MTPMFNIFTLAIEFDCLFLAFFQSFHVFVIFIFDKLAPSWIYVSKDALNYYLNPFHNLKQSQKCSKRGIFLILHFGRHTNGGL